MSILTTSSVRLNPDIRSTSVWLHPNLISSFEFNKWRFVFLTYDMGFPASELLKWRGEAYWNNWPRPELQIFIWIDNLQQDLVMGLSRVRMAMSLVYFFLSHPWWNPKKDTSNVLQTSFPSNVSQTPSVSSSLTIKFWILLCPWGPHLTPPYKFCSFVSKMSRSCSAL